MKIIFLSDVYGSGKRYEVKEVPDGYAMNFLLPNKLAEQATPDRIKKIEQTRQEQLEEEKIQQDLLEKNLSALKDLRVEIKEKANEKGHLFKGITAQDVAKAIQKQANIELPHDLLKIEKPIKDTGEFSISVLAGKKKTSFTLVVSGR